MQEMLTWIKLVFAALMAFFSWMFGGIDALFYALLACIAIDYVTGVLTAIYEKRLSSRAGFRGILKKIVILLIVALTHMLENAAGITGVRDLVIGFYIANEGISILENAGRMNIPVARELKQFLEQLREKDDIG